MDKVSTPPSPKAEESLIPFYMALARAKQPSPTPDPLHLHVEAALDIEGCIDDCNSHAATLIAEAQHQLSLPACVFLPADYDVTTDDKLSDPRRTKLSKMVIENGDRALAASQKTFGRVMGLIDKHQTEGLEALSMPEEDVVLSPSPPAPQTPRVSPTPKPSKLPKRSSSQKSAVPVAKGASVGCERRQAAARRSLHRADVMVSWSAGAGHVRLFLILVLIAAVFGGTG